MKKSPFVLFSLMLMSALVLSACGPSGSAPAAPAPQVEVRSGSVSEPEESPPTKLVLVNMLSEVCGYDSTVNWSEDLLEVSFVEVGGSWEQLVTSESNDLTCVKVTKEGIEWDSEVWARQ